MYSASKKKLIVSDLEAEGKSFSEVQTSINDNHLTIRMQKHVPEEESKPCCECVSEKNCNVKPGRTMIVMPNGDKSSKNSEEDEEEEEKATKTEELKEEKLHHDISEINPNIFTFKFMKRNIDRADRYNMNVDLKIPRPWSKEMKKYIENLYNPKPKIIDFTVNCINEKVCKKEEKGL